MQPGLGGIHRFEPKPKAGKTRLAPSMISVLGWVVGGLLMIQVHPWFASDDAGPWYGIGLEFLVWQGASLAIWMLVLRLRPGTAGWVGQLLLSGFPLLYCVDVWLFRLTGIHLLSQRLVQLVRDVPAETVSFATTGVGISIASLMLAWLAALMIAAGFQLAFERWCPRFIATELRWRRTFAIGAVVAWSILLVLPRLPLTHRRSEHPAQHLVTPSQESTSKFMNHLVREIPESVANRMHQMRMNVVVDERTQASLHPDILIVIGESLRPELLTEEVMPHAFELTRRGMWLRKHYSGGNSSSLGVFSIISGLEAVWFYKSDVRFAPAMNRLFRQAGYELGFFASTNDWPTFQMDAFLSPQQYDVFESHDFTGLDADERAIAATSDFLDSDPKRPPRLAVLCLYGTHAPFWCDDDSSTNVPAAGPSYPIPFPPSWQTRVENRYRNAARTMDASIAELLSRSQSTRTGSGDRSCIIVLTGDHGESFGADGTIGHGTKLSIDQTHALAVIAGPRIPHVEMNHASGHFDYLPTLLSAAGITTSLPNQFDGRVLTEFDGDWQSRSFAIAGYVGKEIAIIQDAASEEATDAAWALKCEFSMMDGRAAVEFPINGTGDRVHSSTIGPETLVHWLSRQFGRLPK